MQFHTVVVTGRLHLRHGLALFVRDIEQQHRMMGGERAAGLGNHVGVRQVMGGALFGQGMDNVPGVIGHAIVHRAVGARVRAFVVHAEAAAHVHGIHRRAQATQFHVVAGRLAHAGLDVLDVGHL